MEHLQTTEQRYKRSKKCLKYAALSIKYSSKRWEIEACYTWYFDTNVFTLL